MPIGKVWIYRLLGDWASGKLVFTSLNINDAWPGKELRLMLQPKDWHGAKQEVS